MEILTRLSSRRPTVSKFLASPYEPAIEREFFARVVLSNGSIKTTYEHRLDDLNQLALPYLHEFSPPLEILDVAASSGVSSAEWYEQLTSFGIRCSLTATDLTVNAFHTRTGTIEAVLDKELQVIHLGINGLGMHPNAKGKFFHNFITRSVKAYIRWRLQRGLEYEPIRLVSKRFDESPNLQMVEHDLVDGNSVRQNQFHAIRAANVLNRAYFSDDVLSQIVKNLKTQLLRGGLLIVCRTDKSCRNSATLFRFEGSRFSVLARMGAGCDVEDLILTP